MYLKDIFNTQELYFLIHLNPSNYFTFPKLFFQEDNRLLGIKILMIKKTYQYNLYIKGAYYFENLLQLNVYHIILKIIILDYLAQNLQFSLFMVLKIILKIHKLNKNVFYFILTHK